MELSQLFYNCAYTVQYEQIGDSVNYAFVEDGKTLYVYFQGSNSITDWVRNFLFKKKPYKDMETIFRVHSGFLAAWKEMEDRFIAKITQKEEYGAWNFKYDHITVVGYSHGAALAAFAAEATWYYRPDLRENGFEAYGFEAPRIYGGFCVRDDLKERWKNFTVIRTNNDIVTHCPPIIFGYCHVGNLLKVKGDTSLVENKWIPKCVKSHYPQVVYDALVKYEEENKDK